MVVVSSGVPWLKMDTHGIWRYIDVYRCIWGMVIPASFESSTSSGAGTTAAMLASFSSDVVIIFG